MSKKIPKSVYCLRKIRIIPVSSLFVFFFERITAFEKSKVTSRVIIFISRMLGLQRINKFFRAILSCSPPLIEIIVEQKQMSNEAIFFPELQLLWQQTTLQISGTTLYFHLNRNSERTIERFEWCLNLKIIAEYSYYESFAYNWILRFIPL